MTSPPPPSQRFRRDIQGMRAVAILLVLVYHAELVPLTGGYVGVDVFFVISGYLITAHLLREFRTTGKVDLRAFWARRIRRLLPASWLVLFATLLAGAALVLPLQREAVAKDGLFTAIYGANVWLAARMTDYLNTTDPSVFQHYWSLALEEQFYLVWPLLLMSVLVLARSRAYWLVFGVVLGSFFLGVWMTGWRQPLAFFLLPARAWELGVGALLAMTPLHYYDRAGSGTRAMLAAAGLGLILSASVLFDNATAWPGWAALVPVLGSALIIAWGEGQHAVSILLSSRPAQYFGRISYSLYLWHWPILVLAQWGDRGLGWWERTLLVGLSIAAADVTERWVEQPFKRRLGASRNRPYVALAAGTVTSIAVGFTLLALPMRLTTDQPIDAWRPSEDITALADPGFVPKNVTPALDAAMSQPLVYEDGCHLNFLETRPPGNCVYGAPDAERAVILIGDSHAAHWLPPLDALGRKEFFSVYSLTKSSCPAVDMEVWLGAYGRPYRECSEWRSNALGIIRELSNPTVVLAESRNHAPLDGSGEQGYAAALASTLDAFGDLEVVVVGDGPWFETAPAVCLSGNVEDSSRCTKERSEVVVEQRANTQFRVARAKGATFVDTADWICSSSQCAPLAGNVLKFRDANHLTVEYAIGTTQRWRETLRLVTSLKGSVG